MNFDLNLILTFTDRATSGLQSAVTGISSLQEQAQRAGSSSSAALSALSMSASQTGQAFLGAGGKIMNTLTGIVNSVNTAGRTVQSARIGLGKLYSDSDNMADMLNAGAKKVQQISDYAAHSIFDFEGLIPVVQMLKANGIEAFDEITSSTGKSRQMLMDYAADLAAFNPAMHNAYGTGIQAAMGALNEYIAEGNTMSLKRGASLDILQLLGEDKGKTIEERSRQVADLIEQLGMVGMTKSMEGTPQQILSNLGDVLFQFKTAVADSGVYEEWGKTLGILGDYFNKIDSKEIKEIAGIIGDALKGLLKPVQLAAKWFTKLMDGFRSLIKTNPWLAKVAVTIAAISGGSLIAIGAILKLVSAFAGLASVLQFSTLTGQSFFGAFTQGFGTLIRTLGPAALLMGILALAWHTDLFGIQTMIMEFVSNLANAFNGAREAVKMSTSDMMEHIRSLDENSFFGGLEIGLIKIITVFKALKESWKDYTISGKTYERLQALGLAELVGRILDFKYRVEQFIKGFKEGWKSMSETVHNVMASIGKNVEGTPFEGFFKSAEKFFTFLTNNDPKKWENAGEIIGKIAPFVVTLTGALLMFNRVSRPIQQGGGLLGGLLGGRNSGGGNGGLLGGSGMNPRNILRGMVDLGIIIGGVTAIITALGALSSVPGFNEFISNGVRIMTKIFSVVGQIALSAVGMGVAIALLDRLKVNPKSALMGIANIAIILGGLDLIITALGALNSIPGFSDFLTTGVGTMSTLGVALENFFSPQIAAVFLGIGLFGAIPISMVLTGIANVALILGAMTGLIVAFGALSQIDGFKDFITNGGETLALLFEQIGKIAGSVIAGFAEGVMSGLPEIGNQLAQFGQNIQPFFDSVKGAPLEEIGSFASGLGTFVLTLGASEFLSIFTGGIDFVGIAQQLADFGTTIAPFFTAVAGYSDEGLEKSPKVFEALASIGNYSFRSGGVAQFFTGEVNLTMIGEQLAAFAPNGATFFNTVAGYSDEGLEKAPKVFEGIAGIGQYSFKTGGLAQLFTGETSLDVIGQQLAAFAPNGKTFFDAVGSYSEQGLDNAPKVFEALNGIGDYDFKSGGIAQLFTGSTDLGSVGEQLTDFGENAKGFFDTMGQVSYSAMSNGVKAIQSLGTLSEFKSGGLVDLFAGSIDITSIGSQLTSFGKNVSGFFTTVEGLSPTSFYNGSRVFQVLEAVGSGAFRSGGVAQFFTGSVSIASIGTQLSQFATNVEKFFTTAEGISPDAFANAPKVFSSLQGVGSMVDIAIRSAGSLAAFGTELTQFGTDMVTFSEKANSLDGGGIAALSKSLETLATTFENTAGRIQTGSQKVSNAVKQMATNYASSATKVTTETEKMGSAMDKFSSKVSSNVGKVNGALSTMTSAFSSSSGSMVSSMNTASTGVTNALGNLLTGIRSKSTEIKNEISKITQEINKLNNTKANININVNKNETTTKRTVDPDKRAVGGVFTSAHTIEVGEDGAEVVMPLEKNLGWIHVLAAQLKSSMRGTNAVNNSALGATDGVPNINVNTGANDEVLASINGYASRLVELLSTKSPSEMRAIAGITESTSIDTGNTAQTYYTPEPIKATPLATEENVPVQKRTTEGSVQVTGSGGGDYSQDNSTVDNSVTFQPGSIVIQAHGASESEMQKMAEYIMSYVERKRQIDNMNNYGIKFR